MRDVAGFDPYPGTLNVRLADAADLDRWRTVRDQAALPVTPPRPEDCGGRLVPVRLGAETHAAVVIPDITRYEDDVLEIIAADHLRTCLGLRDDDVVSVVIRSG